MMRPRAHPPPSHLRAAQMPFRLRRRLLALLAQLHGVSDALSSQVAAQEYTTEKAPPNLHRPRYARMPL